MRARAEWTMALSVMAAVAGIGFASGRQIVLFFAQLGDAMWISIAAASVLFGFMTGVAAWRARRFGARAAGGVPERIRELLRLLLAAIVTAMLLARAGDIGALTLPVRHGYAVGAASALLAALVLAGNGAAALPGIGVAAVAMGGLFYTGMAADPRPVRIYARSETVLKLAGSVPAALLLAVLYAAIAACAAAWQMSRISGSAVRPSRVGAYAAAMLCALLAAANLALKRGGDALLAQAMPWVVLSARWGLAGFWLCAGFEALCAVATLSASLGSMIGALEGQREVRNAAMLFLLVAIVLFLVLSHGRY